MREPIRGRPTISSWTCPRRRPAWIGSRLFPLNQALDWIVEWYRAFQGGDDLRRLTRKQIERYEALLQDAR